MKVDGDSVCNKLTMRWPQREGDRSVFDIDLLVEYGKRLQ